MAPARRLPGPVVDCACELDLVDGFTAARAPARPPRWLYCRLAGGTVRGSLCGPQFRSLQILAGSADLPAFLKTSGLYPRQPRCWAPVRGLTRTAIRDGDCSRH